VTGGATQIVEAPEAANSAGNDNEVEAAGFEPLVLRAW
jgi:hypothetical protein